MTEKVILELPDEMLQRAQAAAKRTGRDVQEVLKDWIARGAERDVESLILPNVEYPIYTLLGNEAAAPILLEALKAHQAKDNKQD
jgi:hypothetical protein